MAKIISIATAVPEHQHKQQDILRFMEGVYEINEQEKRILRYLYQHSSIDTRYSVIADYTLPMDEWLFFPKSKDLEPFPKLERRMKLFQEEAPKLSVKAIDKCINGFIGKEDITHIITVSCTGLSAPGLEMQLIEMLDLKPDISRSAINYMGCYAAIHGLKQANDIVTAQPDAKVLLVCTELCTLHFQKQYAEETVMAPLLFGDGCAAVLITADADTRPGIRLASFHAEIMKDSKSDMAWHLSSLGFVMTLSGEVPDIFEQEVGALAERAMLKAGITRDQVKHWCMHPGGKRILEALGRGLSLSNGDLATSYGILRNYGNMSSPTVLFVLKELWEQEKDDKGSYIFGAAFGPGLTMESMTLQIV